MKNDSKLPTPSEEAIKHSHKLLTSIKNYANSNGQLTFAQFMHKALYTSQLGYYSNSLVKIGAKGDFITAPEISPLFSHCIARQASQILAEISVPNIIEFGAGRGTMAKDILLELHRLNQPVEAYYIIELSADLKIVQQQTLQQLPAEIFNKIHWLDSLPSTSLSAVVLANEVLDAMPVERVKFEPEKYLQAWVKFNEKTNQAEWDYQTVVDPQLQKQCEVILEYTGKPSTKGYNTEINLNIQPWLNSIADFISEGVVLLIDYGYQRKEYYQPARVMGTLRCHYQHLAHDNPFFYPGLQDITAHVDFTAVAESALKAGFNVEGFTTQAHFLMGSGLLEMSSQPTDDVTKSLLIAQQIKTLTLPDEMGETFKVMALTKHFEQALIGFQLRDLKHLL